MSHQSIISKTLLREASRLGQEECQRPRTGRRLPPPFLGEFTLEKGGPGMWPYEGGEARKDGRGAGMGEVNSAQQQTGKGNRKRLNHPLADSLSEPSRHAQTQLCSQGAGEGSHTAIFKTDKKRACWIVVYLQTQGLLRLVPTSRADGALPAGRAPGQALSHSGLPFSPRAGAGRRGPLESPLLWPNGNTPPRAPETPEGQPYGADPRSVTCPQGPSGCLGLDSPHFPVGSMLTRPGAACSWRSPPRCWGPGPAVAKGPLKAGARAAAGKEPGETSSQQKSAWPTPVPGGGVPV